jgi:ABC-2 type transport system permease protein
MLSLYWEVIRIRFLAMLAYRVNYYSGIIIYSLNIGVYYFLWTAVYGGSTSLNGLTVAQMATYIAISWMARAFYFNNLDQEIAQEIREGAVAVQLIRPYQYLLVKGAQGFGEGLFRLLLFSVPGMIIVSFVFPIALPAFGAVWGKFALSMFLGFLINVQINLLIGILTFYLLNNQGLLRAKRVIVDLLSGVIVPISFYPGWAEAILSWLPFQAISYLPSIVLVKGLSGADFWQAIGVQLLWCVLLCLPIVFIWQRAKKIMSVQGG